MRLCGPLIAPVQVLRRVAGSGTFASVGTVPTTATTFTDNNAVNASANSYEYQLSLTNGCGTANTTGVAQTIRLQATATPGPGGRNQGSTALAAAPALVQAANACGAGAIFVVDNLGVVNRARAVLASIQGTSDQVPAFVIAAERASSCSPNSRPMRRRATAQPRLIRRMTMPPTPDRRRCWARLAPGTA